MFLVFFLLFWMCVWMSWPFGIFIAAIRWRAVSFLLFLLFFLCLLFLQEKIPRSWASWACKWKADQDVRNSELLPKLATSKTRAGLHNHLQAACHVVQSFCCQRGVSVPFYVSGALIGFADWSVAAAAPLHLAVNCTAVQAGRSSPLQSDLTYKQTYRSLFIT